MKAGSEMRRSASRRLARGTAHIRVVQRIHDSPESDAADSNSFLSNAPFASAYCCTIDGRRRFFASLNAVRIRGDRSSPGW